MNLISTDSKWQTAKTEKSPATNIWHVSINPNEKIVHVKKNAWQLTPCPGLGFQKKLMNTFICDDVSYHEVVNNGDVHMLYCFRESFGNEMAQIGAMVIREQANMIPAVMVTHLSCIHWIRQAIIWEQWPEQDEAGCMVRRSSPRA